MRHYGPQKSSIGSLIIAIGVAVVGPPALSQTATGTTPSTAKPTPATRAKQPVTTTTTDQMIQEACQRQRARTAKSLGTGKPEAFGSEEPFVFDPTAPPC